MCRWKTAQLPWNLSAHRSDASRSWRFQFEKQINEFSVWGREEGVGGNLTFRRYQECGQRGTPRRPVTPTSGFPSGLLLPRSTAAGCSDYCKQAKWAPFQRATPSPAPTCPGGLTLCRLLGYQKCRQTASGSGLRRVIDATSLAAGDTLPSLGVSAWTLPASLYVADYTAAQSKESPAAPLLPFPPSLYPPSSIRLL